MYIPELETIPLTHTNIPAMYKYTNNASFVCSVWFQVFLSNPNIIKDCRIELKRAFNCVSITVC